MYKRNKETGSQQIRYVAISFVVIAVFIIARLFILQVVDHDYYALFALNSHEIYEKLHPHRGQIYFQDTRTKQEIPAAVNRVYYQVFAVPKDIPVFSVVSTTHKLAELLQLSEEQKNILLTKLSQPKSVYAAVAKKVDEDTKNAIKAVGMPGIYFSPQEFRFYPEENLAGNVLGFVGFDNNDKLVGRYGLEGYWNSVIAGTGGFLAGERGALGNIIAPATTKAVQPENGPDLLLTIDRAIQFKACERLREGMEEYKAKSAALVLVNVKTGAIIAMCSLPDFDPNNYSKTDSLAAFNNTTIFTAYEPGSVFKSFTLAAGVDAGLISPNTQFTDPCERVINGYRVRNAQRKCYGVQTMTQVLENSINTGAVWVEEKLGGERFRDYIRKFGFGDRTGISLQTEVAGDISSLDKKGAIFGANGSFGQGLTATPLQVAMAYAAIANKGKLMKPYIVSEARYPSGKIDRTNPEVINNVLSPRAAELTSAMLVSVVENHYKAARIPHYYVAGKTGTAQISERGGYSADRTNHTFAGFGPANDAQFALVVKFEEPERQWAEQTALPVFRDVLAFTLDYYGIPGTR